MLLNLSPIRLPAKSPAIAFLNLERTVFQGPNPLIIMSTKTTILGYQYDVIERCTHF